MSDIEELKVFATNIQQDVIARADAEEDGAFRAEAFAELMFSMLVDAGEIDDGIACNVEARGVRCSGYYLSEDNDRLDLFIVLPYLDGAATSVPKADIDTAFRRLKAYLDKAITGQMNSKEEALSGYDMSRAIWTARDDLSHVRLFVLTDGLANIEQIQSDVSDGLQITSHLWDLRRMHRAVSSGLTREPIRIRFDEVGGPVRCLIVSPPDSGYRCLLAVFSGDILVEMYRQHGPRLLERNVRSFLQLKGKVNQDIRRTILEEPQMFLAFNNGLSVTAVGVELLDHGDGTADILAADDFQIVNGGQTTGSIFRASRKDKADAKVAMLNVPVKITEILTDGDIENIAPRISQSANHQNKVNIADFSSNHPFQRKMQEISRSIWAPAVGGMQRQTRWFYERARGQYHDALAQNRTDAERRKWELIHPRSQLVTKTDLAKYEHSWSQFPHIVSRGGQKCYLDFMDHIEDRGGFVPDEAYFERAMARAILFRQTEKIVSRQKFGGYRANIVTYSIAWLSFNTAKRIDLGAIWSNQELSPSLADFLEAVSVHAHEHITSPSGGQNITEWCKKEACWEKFKTLAIPLPAALEAELLSRDKGQAAGSASVLEEQNSAAESEIILSIAEIPAQTWFDLAAWAKDTQTFEPWQRSLAFSLGKLANNGKQPTRKQALQAQKIILAARSLGFRG